MTDDPPDNTSPAEPDALSDLLDGWAPAPAGVFLDELFAAEARQARRRSLRIIDGGKMEE
jgi:hypothetical protein